MEYMDEKLLKQKKQRALEEQQRFEEETIEQEIKGSIYDDILYIFKMPVRFTERVLLEEGISLWMPSDFEIIPAEMVADYFPLGNKPQYVYANDYLPLTIGFNKTQHTIPDHNMKEFSELAQTLLKKLGPSVKILGNHVFYKEEHTIATVEFISQALDGPLFNKMIFLSIEGSLLIGFIHYPVQYSNRLKVVADEVINSIKILVKEGGK